MLSKQSQIKQIIKLAEELLLIADEIEGEVDYLQYSKNWKQASQVLEEVEENLLNLAVKLKVRGEKLLKKVDKFT